MGLCLICVINGNYQQTASLEPGSVRTLWFTCFPCWAFCIFWQCLGHWSLVLAMFPHLYFACKPMFLSLSMFLGNVSPAQFCGRQCFGFAADAVQLILEVHLPLSADNNTSWELSANYSLNVLSQSAWKYQLEKHWFALRSSLFSKYYRWPNRDVQEETLPGEKINSDDFQSPIRDCFRSLLADAVIWSI